MFRIETFCEDNKVGAALRALVGLVHGHPKVTPVSNAKASKNGEIKALTNGSPLAVFMKHLHDNSVERVTMKEMRQFMPHIGLQPNSAYAIARKALLQKALRKKGSGPRTQYLVLPAKE
jgi:hypothetical protein